MQKSSNPSYLRTVTLRASEGMTDSTELRLTAYDLRERLTSTCAQLGRAQVTVEHLKTEGK